MSQSRVRSHALKSVPPRGRGATRQRERAAEPAGFHIPEAHRPFLLLIVMVLAAGGLVSRLVFWQVMQHGHLSAVAAAEHAAFDVQPPMRGQIFDSQGNLLATDVNMDEVGAVPREIKDRARTAALMAPVLHTTPKDLEGILASDSPYVVLAQRVDQATSQRIRGLALPGIVLDPQIRRAYPDHTVASQILGYTNVDNVGNYGLEGYYDRLLSGTAGLRTVLKDTAGNDIRIRAGPPSPAHSGADLHLALNPVVQGLAEDELQKAVQQHHADGGTVIVMDPRTGYVLGMASRPSYDPNHYNRYPLSRYLDPAIQWNYEPGSTFKIITMAAGLDSGVITPQSTLDDTGTFRVAGISIHNWNMSGFGMENMTQVLQHSANVGASWVAQHLGTSLFYKYVNRFRFGQPTGVDLQGEDQGLLPLPGDKNWTIVNLYTNSYGQGISVTPLQMIRAVAAVANHGVLMKPQVVKQIVYGGRIIDHPGVIEGHVISATTAHTLTNMLVHSAINGEAALAMVKGYNVAAKTGTANVVGPGGGYLHGVTIASTVGYAPAFHPRFVILAIIQHPRDTPWGSMAAAPVLHNLFQDLFMYYHIPPSPHPITK